MRQVLYEVRNCHDRPPHVCVRPPSSGGPPHLEDTRVFLEGDRIVIRQGNRRWVFDTAQLQDANIILEDDVVKVTQNDLVWTLRFNNQRGVNVNFETIHVKTINGESGDILINGDTIPITEDAKETLNHFLQRTVEKIEKRIDKLESDTTISIDAFKEKVNEEFKAVALKIEKTALNASEEIGEVRELLTNRVAQAQRLAEAARQVAGEALGKINDAFANTDEKINTVKTDLTKKIEQVKETVVEANALIESTKKKLEAKINEEISTVTTSITNTDERLTRLVRKAEEHAEEIFKAAEAKINALKAKIQTNSDLIVVLKDEVRALRSITSIRGNVATVADLPDPSKYPEGTSYVVEKDEDHGNVSTIHVTVKENGTYRWQYAGRFNVDLSNFYDKDDIDIKVSAIRSDIEDLGKEIERLEGILDDKVTSEEFEVVTGKIAAIKTELERFESEAHRLFNEYDADRQVAVQFMKETRETIEAFETKMRQLFAEYDADRKVVTQFMAETKEALTTKINKEFIEVSEVGNQQRLVTSINPDLALTNESKLTVSVHSSNIGEKDFRNDQLEVNLKGIKLNVLGVEHDTPNHSRKKIELETDVDTSNFVDKSLIQRSNITDDGVFITTDDPNFETKGRKCVVTGISPFLAGEHAPTEKSVTLGIWSSNIEHKNVRADLFNFEVGSGLGLELLQNNHGIPSGIKIRTDAISGILNDAILLSDFGDIMSGHDYKYTQPAIEASIEKNNVDSIGPAIDDAIAKLHSKVQEDYQTQINAINALLDQLPEVQAIKEFMEAALVRQSIAGLHGRLMEKIRDPDLVVTNEPMDEIPGTLVVTQDLMSEMRTFEHAKGALNTIPENGPVLSLAQIKIIEEEFEAILDKFNTREIRFAPKYNNLDEIYGLVSESRALLNTLNIAEEADEVFKNQSWITEDERDAFAQKLTDAGFIVENHVSYNDSARIHAELISSIENFKNTIIKQGTRSFLEQAVLIDLVATGNNLIATIDGGGMPHVSEQFRKDLEAAIIYANEALDKVDQVEPDKELEILVEAIEVISEVINRLSD